MDEKLRLELPMLLPDVDDPADACIDRLVNNLAARDGVASAHVIRAQDPEPAKLCVHFNSDLLPLQRIREIANSTGAQITGKYGHLRWRVEGLSHQRRARTVTERLRSMPGVVTAHASPVGTISLDFDRDQLPEVELRRALAKLGVKVLGGTAVNAASGSPSKDNLVTAAPATRHEGHDHGANGGEHAHGGIFGANTELYFALICGALLGLGFAIEKTANVSDWVPFGFYVAAYFFGGFFTLREAIDSLRNRKFEIDTLMLVAAAGAAALGAWAEGALLLFLFSFGHSLEHFAMGRAKRAIEALAELAPQSALVRRGGATLEVPVEELKVGDTILIKPNERMPADGFVVMGATSVNQAPVTGESVPVDKQAVDDAAGRRGYKTSHGPSWECGS